MHHFFAKATDITLIQLDTGHSFFAHFFLKNFIKISLIIKECPEEILIKLAIVLKISKSSWNTVLHSYPMTVGDCKKGLSVFTVNWKKYINNKNLREGNLLMLFATLINILPPLRWSPLFTCIYSKHHDCITNIN